MDDDWGMSEHESINVAFVVGRPASGKTTLSRELAEQLRLPLVAKDDIKEILLESLSTGGRDWSIALGIASFDLLDYVVDRMLATGKSFIIEAALDADLGDAGYQELQRRYHFRAVQLHCVAPHAVLVERFKERIRSGERHPGHADTVEGDAFERSLAIPRREVLDLVGDVVELDTGGPEALKRAVDALGAYVWTR